jgi:hypothetical protein
MADVSGPEERYWQRLGVTLIKTYEGLDRAGTEGERVPGRESFQGDRGDWPETPATI